MAPSARQHPGSPGRRGFFKMLLSSKLHKKRECQQWPGRCEKQNRGTCRGGGQREVWLQLGVWRDRFIMWLCIKIPFAYYTLIHQKPDNGMFFWFPDISESISIIQICIQIRNHYSWWYSGIEMQIFLVVIRKNSVAHSAHYILCFNWPGNQPIVIDIYLGDLAKRAATHVLTHKHNRHPVLSRLSTCIY